MISKENQGTADGKEGKLPDAVIACVAEFNAIERFYNLSMIRLLKLIGCEATGRGADTPENSSNHYRNGPLRNFPWYEIYFCQDE